MINKDFPGLKKCNEIEVAAFIFRMFKLTIADLQSKRRTIHFAYARQICYFLLYHAAGLELEKIGDMLQRHHTSVLYGRNTIAEWLFIEEKKTKAIIEAFNRQ